MNEGFLSLLITRIKESTMNKNYLKEYLRRAKAIMKGRLNGKNKIKTMNTSAVSLMRYRAEIIRWTVAEFDRMDRRTRKIMTINNELHPKSDADRLYVTGSKGGKGLM